MIENNFLSEKVEGSEARVTNTDRHTVSDFSITIEREIRIEVET